MNEIPLPHNGWLPRWHQMKLWDYLRDGGKRAVAIWHRRAGKDEVGLHHAAVSMMMRPGNYIHCLPEFAQGRRAVFNAVNPHSGVRRIDEAFPMAMRETTQEHEMLIRATNGSTWQVTGSDTYNTSIVGTSIAGLVMSEYSLANPSAWAYARPVLEENNGWAIFISTPRGRNHAFDMFRHAQRTPDWFAELLTAEDTGALTREQLDEALAEYQALYGAAAGRAQYDQEYMCDWAAAGLLGSFYAYEMAEVRREQRIQLIEPINGPVHRAWDLGMRDDTCIWFWQAVGSQIFLYDCVSTSGASLDWWRDKITDIYRERGWKHGVDWVPQDAKVRELSTGLTRVETMVKLGLAPQLSPNATLQDGINAVRRVLPLCVFHPRCEDTGIAALEQYRREWDDERKCFRQSPLHDWCSDRVDSFRYLALAYRPPPLRLVKPPQPTEHVWRFPPPEEPRRGGIRL